MANISSYSTTAASNNSAAPDGFPEGMAPSGLNDSSREVMAALAKWYSDTDGTLLSTGSADTYTLTTNNVHAALADQSTIVFRVHAANTGASTLNVDSLGAKAIKQGGSALVSGNLLLNRLVVVVYNANKDEYDLVGGGAEIGLNNVVEDTTPQSGGAYDTNSFQDQWSKGADVASATALPVLTDGNYFDVTGTTTIATINTTKVGTVIKLHFDGILILTNSAADLVLLTGANITTAAGDEAEFIEYATGDYRMLNYSRADGTALVSNVGALVFISAQTASASATIEFTSGIDSTFDEYELHILNAIPASDGVLPVLLTSTDGGVGFDSGASDYKWQVMRGTSAVETAESDAADADINLTGTQTQGNATGEFFNSVIRIIRPSEATFTHLVWTIYNTFTSGVLGTGNGVGVRLASEDVNALQFKYTSGNIASGLYALYGVKRS